MKIFGKINTVLEKIFWYVSIAIFAVMLIILTIQVIGRFFGFGLSWSEEFGRYGQIVIVNLGAALVMFDDSHICMSLLEDIFKGKGKIVIKIIRYIVMIIFGAVMIYLSKDSLALAAKSVSAGMGIPMTAVYIVYPIMGGAMIVHSIYLLLNIFLGKKNDAKDNKEVTEA